MTNWGEILNSPNSPPYISHDPLPPDHHQEVLLDCIRSLQLIVYNIYPYSSTTIIMRRLLSCVALLCAVSAAAAAASAPRPDSFQAYLFSAGAAGSAAKTADYDGGYGYEYDKKGYTQHESIALVEARQTQCRYTGR